MIKLIQYRRDTLTLELRQSSMKTRNNTIGEGAENSIFINNRDSGQRNDRRRPKNCRTYASDFGLSEWMKMFDV